MENKNVRYVPRWWALFDFVFAQLLPTLFSALGHFVVGILRFAAFIVMFSSVFVVIYVLMQPLLYAAANHEAAIHDGVLAVQVVEEVGNIGVDVINSGLDVVRPFRPAWNFFWFWTRRVSFFQSRVFIIAIEELVELLLAPDPHNLGTTQILPGCRTGDWTSFADIDLTVCMFDFQSIDAFPQYSARSKIVTDLPALLNDNHPQSDEFWQVMLNYGGPHIPVHHPSDALSAEEKVRHWESLTGNDYTALDGARYAIPLGKWAKTELDVAAVKYEVKSFFNEFPDLTVALYYWDVIFSAMIYGIIDVLGFVADIIYDIMEFVMVLIITVAEEVFLAIYDGIKWMFAHLGPVFSFLISLLQDAAEILWVYLINLGDCVSNNQWDCGATKEVYRCCENWKLYRADQCLSPARHTLHGELTAFGRDTLVECKATGKAVDPLAGEGGNFDMCKESKGRQLRTPYYPYEAEDYYDCADGHVECNELEAGFVATKPDTWPFEDELDTQIYEESRHGLHTCSGAGTATTWQCDDPHTSYLNPAGSFEKLMNTNGPTAHDSTSRVCTEGNPNTVFVSDPSFRVYGASDDVGQRGKMQCMQAHTRHTCIREAEDRGFLHLAGFFDAPRSASMEMQATNPESDPEYVRATTEGGICTRGCGTEKTVGSAGTLDFWGYRNVDVWDCSEDGQVFADGSDPSNSFVPTMNAYWRTSWQETMQDHTRFEAFMSGVNNDKETKNNQVAVPVHVWYVADCPKFVYDQYDWMNKPCGNNTHAHVHTKRELCTQALIHGSFQAHSYSGEMYETEDDRTTYWEDKLLNHPTVIDDAMRKGMCPFAVQTEHPGNLCTGFYGQPRLFLYANASATDDSTCPKTQNPDTPEPAICADGVLRENGMPCYLPLSRPLAVHPAASVDHTPHSPYDEWNANFGDNQDSPGSPLNNIEMDFWNQDHHCGSIDTDIINGEPRGSNGCNKAIKPSELNLIHLRQYCRPKMQQRFAFPHFCRCGGDACMAPLMNYFVDLVGFIENEVSSYLTCSFYFDRNRCCMSSFEPQKPGRHTQSWRYNNFGVSPAIPSAEMAKMSTLQPTEVGPATGFRVRWNSVGAMSGPSSDLLATADELLGGGIGGGQPCFVTSTMLGTEPQCRYDLMEEECCGYCSAWVYKFTRLSKLKQERAPAYSEMGKRIRAENAASHSRCEKARTSAESLRNPGTMSAAADSMLSVRDVVRESIEQTTNSHTQMQAQAYDDIGSHHWITLSDGQQAHAGARAQVTDDSHAMHREPDYTYGDILNDAYKGCTNAPSVNDDTEYSLEMDELIELMFNMEVEDRNFGSLIPGFGGGALSCSMINNRDLDVSVANGFAATCPVSVSMALHNRGKLNMARHASTFHGMPFAEPEEGKRTKRAGFGFWRRMIYLSKFRKNNYKWWMHLQDPGGSTRLPCGCTAPEYCPGRKSTHPWTHGASLHSSGLHAAFNMVNPYHATDEFVQLFALIDAVRLGSLNLATEIPDDVKGEDIADVWRSDVASTSRSRSSALHVQTYMLGVKNEKGDFVRNICANTRDPIGIRAGVDMFLEPGTWNFHTKYCTDWTAQQQCDFYERNFCQYYTQGPQHDTNDQTLQSNPSRFLAETGVTDQGSSGYLASADKRTYGGKCRPSQDNGTMFGGAIDSDTGCTSELGNYIDDLRERYNVMARTQKAVDTDRSNAMSRWWSANIPSDANPSGRDWVRKLNAPMAAYAGLLWDDQLVDEFRRLVAVCTISQAEYEDDDFVSSKAIALSNAYISGWNKDIGRDFLATYPTLSEYIKRRVQLIFQWQSPANNDHENPAAWSFNNEAPGFALYRDDTETIEVDYVMRHTAEFGMRGPVRDPEGEQSDVDMVRRGAAVFAFLSANLYTGGLDEAQMHDVRAGGANDTLCGTAREYLLLLRKVGQTCCAVDGHLGDYPPVRACPTQQIKHYKDLPAYVSVSMNWGQCLTEQVMFSSAVEPGSNVSGASTGELPGSARPFLLTSFQRMRTEENAQTCGEPALPPEPLCVPEDQQGPCQAALHEFFDGCYNDMHTPPQSLQAWLYLKTHRDLQPLYHACTGPSESAASGDETQFQLDTWVPRGTSFANNVTRRNEAMKDLQKEVAEMNTVPPSCYIDLFMPWAPAELHEKPPRRTLGGDNAGQRLKHNLNSRHTAAQHMRPALSDADARTRAIANQGMSDTVRQGQYFSTDSSRPPFAYTGGEGQSTIEGSVFHEAFAAGLYDLRWSTEDWDGVFGARSPPETYGCAQMMSQSDDNPDNDYTVIAGVGTDRCEMGLQRFQQLSQREREVLAYRAEYSGSNMQRRTTAAQRGAMPVHSLTFAVEEHGVTKAGHGDITGTVDTNQDVDIRASVSLRAGCWSAVARQWRARGLQLLDPVAMQQIYQLVEFDSETLRRSFAVSATTSSFAGANALPEGALSDINDPAATPTENQVRYRDLMFANVMERTHEYKLGFYRDPATDQETAYGPQYHHAATFVARVLHPNQNPAFPMPTHRHVFENGTEIEYNPVNDALRAAEMQPSQDRSGIMFRNLNADSHPYLLTSHRDETSDIFLMNTQWSPTIVGDVAARTFVESPDVKANPWGMFEPPASLDAHTARDKSCAKFRGRLGGKYAAEYQTDDNNNIVAGPDGWGGACVEEHCQTLDASAHSNSFLYDEQVQLLGNDRTTRLGDAYRTPLLQRDDLGLTTMMTELTGGLFHPSSGTGTIVGEGFAAFDTTQTDDCFFCMEYDDHDKPFTNGQCPHIDRDPLDPRNENYESSCKSFGKTQQTVESQGVFDPTITSCFASEMENETTIAEEDYDPTIGCLSTAWSTTWPRDETGEELPQCCDDCEFGAVVLRDVSSCFRDFDQCSSYVFEGIEDKLCSAFAGAFMNTVVNGLREVNSAITTLQTWAYGPGGSTTSVDTCPQEFLGADGQCSEDWKRLQAQGASADTTVYSYSTTGDVTGARYEDKAVSSTFKECFESKTTLRDTSIGLLVPIPGAYLAGLAVSAYQAKQCAGKKTTEHVPLMQHTVSTTSSEQRDNFRLQGNLKTETSQFSADSMINAAGVYGPNAPSAREVNYCNFCCDQSFKYCVENNKPHGQCYGCNEAPPNQCRKMSLSPDLQNYVGYCASMAGGDDSKVCQDLSHLDTRLKHGSKAAFENGVSQTDLFRMHNARMQGSHIPPHDYRFDEQGTMASTWNHIEVASPTLAQRDAMTSNRARATGTAEEPYEAMTLGKSMSLDADHAPSVTAASRAVLGAKKPTETETLQVRDTNAETFSPDTLLGADDYYVPETIDKQEIRQSWDAFGPYASTDDARNVHASQYADQWSNPDPANALADPVMTKRYRDAQRAVFGKRETQRHRTKLKLGGGNVYQKQDSRRTGIDGQPLYAMGTKHKLQNTGYTNPYVPGHINPGSVYADDREAAALGAVGGALTDPMRRRSHGAGYNVPARGAVAERLTPGGLRTYDPAPPYPRIYAPKFVADGDNLKTRLTIDNLLLYMQGILAGLVDEDDTAVDPVTGQTMTRSQWNDYYVETIIRARHHMSVKDNNGNVIDYQNALGGCAHVDPDDPGKSYSGCWRRSDNMWPYFVPNPASGRVYRTALTGQRRYICHHNFNFSNVHYVNVSDWTVFTDDSKWELHCALHSGDCLNQDTLHAPCRLADDWIDWEDWEAHNGVFAGTLRNQGQMIACSKSLDAGKSIQELTGSSTGLTSQGTSHWLHSTKGVNSGCGSFVQSEAANPKLPPMSDGHGLAGFSNQLVLGPDFLTPGSNKVIGAEIMSDDIRSCLAKCARGTRCDCQHVTNRGDNQKLGKSFMAHSAQHDWKHIELMQKWQHPDTANRRTPTSYLEPWEVNEVRGSLLRARAGRRHPRDVRSQQLGRDRREHNSGIGLGFAMPPLVHQLPYPYSDPADPEYSSLAEQDVYYYREGVHSLQDEHERDMLLMAASPWDRAHSDALQTQKNREPTMVDSEVARASARTISSYEPTDIEAITDQSVKDAVSETRRAHGVHTQSYDHRNEDGMYCKVIGRRHTMKGSASAQLSRPKASDTVEGDAEVPTFPRCAGVMPLRMNAFTTTVRTAQAAGGGQPGVSQQRVDIPDAFTTEYAMRLLMYDEAYPHFSHDPAKQFNVKFSHTTETQTPTYRNPFTAARSAEVAAAYAEKGYSLEPAWLNVTNFPRFGQATVRPDKEESDIVQESDKFMDDLKFWRESGGTCSSVLHHASEKGVAGEAPIDNDFGTGTSTANSAAQARCQFWWEFTYISEMLMDYPSPDPLDKPFPSDAEADPQFHPYLSDSESGDFWDDITVSGQTEKFANTFHWMTETDSNPNFRDARNGRFIRTYGGEGPAGTDSDGKIKPGRTRLRPEWVPQCLRNIATAPQFSGHALFVNYEELKADHANQPNKDVPQRVKPICRSRKAFLEYDWNRSQDMERGPHRPSSTRAECNSPGYSTPFNYTSAPKNVGEEMLRYDTCEASYRGEAYMSYKQQQSPGSGEVDRPLVSQRLGSVVGSKYEIRGMEMLFPHARAAWMRTHHTLDWDHIARYYKGPWYADGFRTVPQECLFRAANENYGDAGIDCPRFNESGYVAYTDGATFGLESQPNAAVGEDFNPCPDPTDVTNPGCAHGWKTYQCYMLAGLFQPEASKVWDWFDDLWKTGLRKTQAQKVRDTRIAWWPGNPSVIDPTGYLSAALTGTDADGPNPEFANFDRYSRSGPCLQGASDGYAGFDNPDPPDCNFTIDGSTALSRRQSSVSFSRHANGLGDQYVAKMGWGQSPTWYTYPLLYTSAFYTDPSVKGGVAETFSGNSEYYHYGNQQGTGYPTSNTEPSYRGPPDGPAAWATYNVGCPELDNSYYDWAGHFDIAYPHELPIASWFRNFFPCGLQAAMAAGYTASNNSRARMTFNSTSRVVSSAWACDLTDDAIPRPCANANIWIFNGHGGQTVSDGQNDPTNIPEGGRYWHEREEESALPNGGSDFVMGQGYHMRKFTQFEKSGIDWVCATRTASSGQTFYTQVFGDTVSAQDVVSDTAEDEFQAWMSKEFGAAQTAAMAGDHPGHIFFEELRAQTKAWIEGRDDPRGWCAQPIPTEEIRKAVPACDYEYIDLQPKVLVGLLNAFRNADKHGADRTPTDADSVIQYPYDAEIETSTGNKYMGPVLYTWGSFKAVPQPGLTSTGLYINNMQDGLEGFPTTATMSADVTASGDQWSYNPAVWQLLVESTRIPGRYRGTLSGENLTGIDRHSAARQVPGWLKGTVREISGRGFLNNPPMLVTGGGTDITSFLVDHDMTDEQEMHRFGTSIQGMTKSDALALLRYLNIDASDEYADEFLSEANTDVLIGILHDKIGNTADQINWCSCRPTIPLHEARDDWVYNPRAGSEYAAADFHNYMSNPMAGRDESKNSFAGSLRVAGPKKRESPLGPPGKILRLNDDGQRTLGQALEAPMSHGSDPTMVHPSQYNCYQFMPAHVAAAGEFDMTDPHGPYSAAKGTMSAVPCPSRWYHHVPPRTVRSYRDGAYGQTWTNPHETPDSLHGRASFSAADYIASALSNNQDASFERIALYGQGNTWQTDAGAVTFSTALANLNQHSHVQTGILGVQMLHTSYNLEHADFDTSDPDAWTQNGANFDGTNPMNPVTGNTIDMVGYEVNPLQYDMFVQQAVSDTPVYYALCYETSGSTACSSLSATSSQLPAQFTSAIMMHNAHYALEHPDDVYAQQQVASAYGYGMTFNDVCASQARATQISHSAQAVDLFDHILPIGYTTGAQLAKSERLKSMLDLGLVSQATYDRWTDPVSGGAMPCCSSLNCPYMLYSNAAPEYASRWDHNFYGSFVWDTVSLGIMCKALQKYRQDLQNPAYDAMPDDLLEYLQNGNLQYGTDEHVTQQDHAADRSYEFTLGVQRRPDGTIKRADEICPHCNPKFFDTHRTGWYRTDRFNQIIHGSTLHCQTDETSTEISFAHLKRTIDYTFADTNCETAWTTYATLSAAADFTNIGQARLASLFSDNPRCFTDTNVLTQGREIAKRHYATLPHFARAVKDSLCFDDTHPGGSGTFMNGIDYICCQDQNYVTQHSSQCWSNGLVNTEVMAGGRRAQTKDDEEDDEEDDEDILTVHDVDEEDGLFDKVVHNQSVPTSTAYTIEQLHNSTLADGVYKLANASTSYGWLTTVSGASQTLWAQHRAQQAQYKLNQETNELRDLYAQSVPMRLHYIEKYRNLGATDILPPNAGDILYNGSVEGAIFPVGLSDRETEVARRATRVRFGLIPDDDTTLCDDLLRESARRYGGANPDTMDMHHRTAWYACAGLQIADASNASMYGDAGSDKGWLTRKFGEAVSNADGLLHRMSDSLASRALVTARQRADYEAQQIEQQYDDFAERYVLFLEAIGINSTDVVSEFPRYEKYARKYGRPDVLWWYNFTETPPVKPAQPERVVVPWPPQLRVMRRAQTDDDEDVLLVEDVSDGVQHIGDDDVSPLALIVSREIRTNLYDVQRARRNRHMHQFHHYSEGMAEVHRDMARRPRVGRGVNADLILDNRRARSNLYQSPTQLTKAAERARQTDAMLQVSHNRAVSEGWSVETQQFLQAASEAAHTAAYALANESKHALDGASVGPDASLEKHKFKTFWKKQDVFAAEERMYTTWAKDQITRAYRRAHPFTRTANNEMVQATQAMFANSLKDAATFARHTQPIAAYVEQAAQSEGGHLQQNYPMASRIAKHLFAGSERRRSNFEEQFYTEAAGAWDSARRRAAELDNATVYMGEFAPRQSFSNLVGNMASMFELPDLGKEPSLEFVKHLSSAFIASSDIKARALDSLGVRTKSESWTDPTPLREFRHDSRQHTPLGRVVRGVMSRMAPDHYWYEDHDNYTKSWADYFDPGTYVTKNLSVSQFMFVNTLLRHMPHASLGQKLAHPDLAASTVERMTLVLEGVEGKEKARALHPKMGELRDHAVRKTMRRRLYAESSATDGAGGEHHKRRLAEEFVRDSLRSHELIAVAGGRTDGGFRHTSLDVRVAESLSKNCNVGGNKVQWGGSYPDANGGANSDNSCGFIDAVTAGANKRLCVGCSSCMGCYLRPPTCGGRGRVACQTDADCVDARNCDHVHCDFQNLVEVSSNGTRHRELCGGGPHWAEDYDNHEKPTRTAFSQTRLETAKLIMDNFKALAWGPAAKCPLDVPNGDPNQGVNVEKQYECPQTFCTLGNVFTITTQRQWQDREGSLDSTKSQAQIYVLNIDHISQCLEQDSTECLIPRTSIQLSSALHKANLYADLEAWVNCRKRCSERRNGFACDDCNDHADWVFANIQRDCSSVSNLKGPAAYVNAGSRAVNGGTYWMSPIRLTYRDTPLTHETAFFDPATPRGGFTCPCIRPKSDSVMGSFGNGETCVCGDFADQPADVDFEINVENTWTYALYNVVLCYLYMDPEHMCFPAIPWEIGAVPEFEWDIREALIENQVNFTCRGRLGREVQYDPAGNPKCSDEDLQVHLSCPEYSGLVFDDTALIPLFGDTILPSIYVRKAVVNRVVNTARALHFTLRYTVMVIGGRLSGQLGYVWRLVSRFALGGFLAPFMSSSYRVYDGWLTRLWVYPTCTQSVDMYAHECVPAAVAYSTVDKFPCPECCTDATPYANWRQDGGDVYPRDQMDCSMCAAIDFQKQEQSTTGIGVHGTYRPGIWPFGTFLDTQRPLLVDVECVRPGETAPSIQMSLCFWVQAGSVMWVSLMLMVGYGFWRAFRPSIERLWHIVRKAITVLFFGLFNVKVPDMQTQEHLVHAATAAEAMQALGFRGEWSLHQVTRPLRRRVIGAVATAWEFTGARAQQAFDGWVRSAARRASGENDLPHV